jgi:hypothetical protein
MPGKLANALKMLILAIRFWLACCPRWDEYAGPSRQKLPVPGQFCRMDHAIWDVEGLDDRIE